MDQQLNTLVASIDKFCKTFSNEEIERLIQIALTLSDSYDRQIQKSKRSGNFAEATKLIEEQRVITDAYWRLKYLLSFEPLKKKLMDLQIG